RSILQNEPTGRCAADLEWCLRTVGGAPTPQHGRGAHATKATPLAHGRAAHATDHTFRKILNAYRIDSSASTRRIRRIGKTRARLPGVASVGMCELKLPSQSEKRVTVAMECSLT